MSSSSAASSSSSSSSASSMTTKKVNHLKESLVKIISKQHPNENDEPILDILSNLDKLPIDVNVLAATLIGATVSKLKSNSNDVIKSKAKTLVKKWKQVAKESGVVSSSSSGTNTNNAKPQQQQQQQSAKQQHSSPPKREATPSAAESISQFDHLPPFRKNSATKLCDTFQLSKSFLENHHHHHHHQQQQEEEEQQGQNDDNDKKASSSSITATNNDDNNNLTATDIIITKSLQVEEAIQTYSSGNRKSYIDKIRSLLFNLKKNTSLRNSVLLSTLSPTKLITLSPQQLQTTEKLKQQQEQVKNLQGSRRLDWEQANADKVNEMCGIKGELLKASLFTCGRCKSHKTTSTQKQTRSADEPMTVFVFCENCGNRWKC